MVSSLFRAQFSCLINKNGPRKPSTYGAPMDDERRAKRRAVVAEHMESENRLDFEATIATFSHPRYELMGSGVVHEGEARVREYFRSSRAEFPDQRNENVELRDLDDGVLAEFDLLGTHARTGGTFRSRIVAMFLFDDSPDNPRIICERVYFDRQQISDQIRSSTSS